MSACRILCVDDDLRINELNRVAFSRLGYEVETTTSPAAALELLRGARFDLVITDLFRPASADASFLAELRSLCPSIAIILVTGDHDPAPEVLQHADVFIEKAYSIGALTESVRKLLDREKLRLIG